VKGARASARFTVRRLAAPDTAGPPGVYAPCSGVNAACQNRRVSLAPVGKGQWTDGSAMPALFQAD